MVFGISLFSGSSNAIKISEKRFEKMYLSNDVKKVVLLKNQGVVEVFLKEDALQNSKYIQELEK